MREALNKTLLQTFADGLDPEARKFIMRLSQNHSRIEGQKVLQSHHEELVSTNKLLVDGLNKSTRKIIDLEEELMLLRSKAKKDNFWMWVGLIIGMTGLVLPLIF